MKKRNLLAVLALLAILISFSGCLGPRNSSKNQQPSELPGLVITNAQTDFNSVDSGETMDFAVSFENRGDSTAKDIDGVLIRRGSFTINPIYVNATADIEPPIQDVFGGDEFTWEITAPNITQDRTEELQARVYYNYSTQGFATIHFVPRDIIREKGQAAFPIDSSSSNGPLNIEIVANQPVILRNSPSEATVRITVIVNNNWNGRIESSATPHGHSISSSNKKGDCTGALDCIDSLNISGFGATCNVKQPDGSFAPLSISETGVRMVQGQQARKTYALTFKINDPNAETSCQIRAEATYRYRVDSSVIPITIKAPI